MAAKSLNPAWVQVHFSPTDILAAVMPNSTAWNWTALRAAFPSNCIRKPISKSQAMKTPFSPITILIVPLAMCRSAIFKSTTRSIIGCTFPSTTISLQRLSTSCAPAALWRLSPPAVHWTKKMPAPASTSRSAVTSSVQCACPTMRSRAAAQRL